MQNMRTSRIVLLISGVGVLALVLLFLWFRAGDREQTGIAVVPTTLPPVTGEIITFVCSSGETFAVQYEEAARPAVAEVRLDEQTYRVERVSSEIGTRYVGIDGIALLTENPTETTLAIGSRRLIGCSASVPEETVVQDELNDRSLQTNGWRWEGTVDQDGTAEPSDPNQFVLSFDAAGRFSAQTDCNDVGGSYKAVDGELVWQDMISTKMFCEASQEEEYVASLSAMNRYELRENILVLTDGQTTMTFSAFVIP